MSRVRLIAAAVAVALVVVCPFASAAGAPLFPVTVTAANGSVALTERPQRILSLSATATEERNGVIPVSDDIASRWGPRVVEFARLVAQVARRS
jgi:hypothetical protein